MHSYRAFDGSGRLALVNECLKKMQSFPVAIM